MDEKTLLIVYDDNLNVVGGFDGYKSLIWAKRYFEVGDCEIYAPATEESVAMLKIGRFVRKFNETAVCLLVSVEIESSAEDGDYITAKGVDASGLLDRRIVWTTTTCNGRAEKFLLRLAADALGEGAGETRAYLSDAGVPLFRAAEPSGLAGSLSMQVTYKPVGETIREVCRRFGWGSRVELQDGIMVFSVYAGADRSGSVVFSDELENLVSSDYVRDEKEAVNVAIIAGEGEGAARAKETIGNAAGRGRFEIYVDARDLSHVLTWGELLSGYPRTPDGPGYVDKIGDAWVYRLSVLNVPILSEAQKEALMQDYPNGRDVEVDGADCWQILNVIAADIPSDAPEMDEEVTLRDILYSMYLLARGADKLAAYGVETKFEGAIEPETTFVYGKDYFLGDIVTVRNHYGISAKVRITAVIEVADENGFSIQPSFEHLGGE